MEHSILSRPWAIGILFILLAFVQTLIAHFSMTGSFDLIPFLDLSAFYIIPIVLWLLLFFSGRSSVARIVLTKPLSIASLIVAGLILVPVHRALSMTVDFGCRWALGLIDRIDSNLLVEIYPYFLSSLPENYLTYLLFIGIALILDSKEAPSKSIKVKSTEGYHWINTHELEAIYSDRNYVIFQLAYEQIKCRMTISSAEDLLAKYGAVRIHRSVLINPKSIVNAKYLGDQCFQLFTISGKSYSSSAKYKKQMDWLIARNSSLLS